MEKMCFSYLIIGTDRICGEIMKEQNVLAKTEERQTNTKFALFKNKSFLLVWLAGIFTSLAGSMYTLTVSWYVVKESGAGQILGVVLMVASIPRLFLMPVGGVTADRFKRSRIMIVSDSARALLIFVMAFCVMTNVLSIPLLLVFAFLFGTLEAFYWPATNSVLPAVVPKNHLAQANSFNALTQQAGLLTGSLIAGGLLTLFSYGLVFVTISVFLAISSFFLFFVREEENKTRKKQGNPLSVMQDLREGLNDLKKDTFAFSLILTTLIASFFFSGPINIAIPLYVEEILHGSALDLSYLEMALSAGMIIGAIFLALVTLRFRRALIAMILIALNGLSLVGLGLTNRLLFGMGSLFFCGFVLISGNTLLVTLLQERIPVEKLGRIMGLMTTFSIGLTPVSHGVFTIFLNHGFSVSLMLIICGSCIVLFQGLILAVMKGIRAVD